MLLFYFYHTYVRVTATARNNGVRTDIYVHNSYVVKVIFCGWNQISSNFFFKFLKPFFKLTDNTRLVKNKTRDSF